MYKRFGQYVSYALGFIYQTLWRLVIHFVNSDTFNKFLSLNATKDCCYDIFIDYGLLICLSLMYQTNNNNNSNNNNNDSKNNKNNNNNNIVIITVIIVIIIIMIVKIMKIIIK